MMRKAKNVLRTLFYQFIAWTYYIPSNKDTIQLKGTSVRFKVNPATSYGRELIKFQGRRSEPFIIPILKAFLKPGDIFFDIGAHWGTYSMVGCQLVGPTGKVVALEPYLPSYKRLCANAKLNNFNNFVAINSAVGSTKTEGFLSIGGSGDNLNQLTEPTSITKTKRCSVTDLRSVLNDLSIDQVRLMKMDIEGGESEVFKDLADYINRFSIVLIELHPAHKDFMNSQQKIYQGLSASHRLFVIFSDKKIFKEIQSYDQFEEHIKNYYFLSINNEKSTHINLKSITW